jgi:hypothetical protein
MNKGMPLEIQFASIVFSGVSLTLFQARGTKFKKKGHYPWFWFISFSEL